MGEGETEAKVTEEDGLDVIAEELLSGLIFSHAEEEAGDSPWFSRTARKRSPCHSTRSPAKYARSSCHSAGPDGAADGVGEGVGESSVVYPGKTARLIAKTNIAAKMIARCFLEKSFMRRIPPLERKKALWSSMHT